jgi:sarcosine oxidase subunit gamma
MSESTGNLTSDESGVDTTISKMAPRGMISVRGNLKSTKLIAAIDQAAGVSIPESGRTCLTGDMGCVWMSPDELLVLVNHKDVAKKLAIIQDNLSGAHSLVVDVSDARIVFEIKGNSIRDVLARLTPADISHRAFGPGQVRRTRIAQVAGSFWLLDYKKI